MAGGEYLLLEPSTHMLFLCALGSLALGSYLSISEGLVVSKAAEGLKKSTLITIVALPVVGSVVLLLVFYLLDIMRVLLVVFLAFASFSSCATLWHGPLAALCARLGLPRAPYAAAAVAVPLALAAAAWWAATRAWALSNGLALHLAVAGVAATRMPSGRSCALLLGVFLAYDVFWVFLSPLFFGGSSVMESVAIGLLPSAGEAAYPILLSFPRWIDSGFNLLGLGDIILPGVYLSFLYRMDVLKEHLLDTGMRQQRKRYRWLEFYFPTGLAAYFLSLVWTMIMLVILKRGQPALLYLVPGVLLSTMAQAAFGGASELSELLKGEYTIQAH
eukprot:m51a1_g7058 hypothetical protein (331) ;mRNA; f:167327-168585